MQYCSLQHQTLLSPTDTSTTGHSFCFGSVSSFFLELFLHSSPVAYWAPINLGSHIFLSFHAVHVFLMERILKCLAIPSSCGPHFVRTLHYDHSVLVALQVMAHSFNKLHKPLCHDKALTHDGVGKDMHQDFLFYLKIHLYQ